MRTGRVFPYVLCFLVFASLLPLIFAAPAPAPPAPPTPTDIYGRYDTRTVSTSLELIRTSTGSGEAAQEGFEIRVVKITTIRKQLSDAEKRRLLEQLSSMPADSSTPPDVLSRIAQQYVNKPVQQYDYVQNAHVSLEYMQASTGRWAPVPGGEFLQTTQVKTENRLVYDPATAQLVQRDIQIYYTTYAVPRTLYSGRCVDFRATFIPRSDVPSERDLAYSQESGQVCDRRIDVIAPFATGIAEIFGPAGLTPADSRYWSNIAIAVLLGMLLSSMYFSGRSPISLLDIAQPRLPGPKSLAAGGQILGPFGYTELKTTTSNKIKAGTVVLGLAAGSMRLGAGTSSLIASMTSAIKPSITQNITKAEAEQARVFGTALGSLYAKVGGEVSSLRPLLTKRIQDYDSGDHQLLSRTLNEIERKGTAHDLMVLRTVRHQIEGTLLFMQLNRLTGVEGSRFTRGLLRRKLISETIGGGRYSVLSYWLAPMVDSTIRSTMVVGRGIKAVPPNAAFFLGEGIQKFADWIHSPRLKTSTQLAVRRIYDLLKVEHPDRIAIGGKSPVLEKAVHQYNIVMDEAHRDLMRFVLKKLYERYGVVLELRQLLEELPEHQRDLHGMLLVNLAEKAGVSAAKVLQLREIEAEIRTMLGSSLQAHEKLARLVGLAEGHGVVFTGTAFQNALNALTAIRTSTLPEHLRLFELERRLQEFHADRGVGEFRFLVGRSTAAVEHMRLTEQEAFEAIVLRRMIQDIETGRCGEGAGIESALNSAYVGRENRWYTANPLAAASHLIKIDAHGDIERSKELLAEADRIARQAFGGGELPRHIEERLLRLGISREDIRNVRGIITGEELIAMHERSLKALRSLLTEEGKRELRDIFGAGFDPNRATMNELRFLLYGGPAILRERGFTSAQIRAIGEDFDTALNKGVIDPRTGRMLWFGGAAREFKPNPEHWKADMGRLWAKAPSDRESIAITQWVKNRFARPHEAALNVDVERILDSGHGALQGTVASRMEALRRMGLSEAEALEFIMETRGLQARELWSKKEMLWDIFNELNSFTPSAYEVTGRRIRDLSHHMAALLADALEKENAGRYAEDIAYLHGRPMSGGRLSEEDRLAGLKSKLSEMLQNSEVEHILKKYMEKPVSYSDITTGRQVWVMLHEGGMVPYVKGMKLSDNDRIMGGYIAIRDERGMAHRFDHNMIKINLTGLTARELAEHEEEFGRLLKKRQSALSAEEHAEYEMLARRRTEGAVLSASEQQMLEGLEARRRQALTDAESRRLEELQVRLRLQMAWNAVAQEIDPRAMRETTLGERLSWQDLINGLKQWKEEGTAEQRFEREKIFAAVVWRYANVTHDWETHWHDARIEVVSKRDAAPFAPQFVRYFVPSATMPFAKPVRNALLSLGDVISRVSLAAGGPVLSASYAVTPFSEYYRLQSWRLTDQILRMRARDWEALLAEVADPAERAKLKSAYEAMALSHGAYHQAWDYVIDRNPWRTSCSYGAHQAWASFFQFGPTEPYPLRFNLRALYTGQQFTPGGSSWFNRLVSGAEWATFYAQYGWQMRAARALFLPYAIASRAFQMSMQGYPTRWDIKESPMKPWNYTSPRLGEAFRAMSPFYSFTKINLPFNIPVPAFFEKIPLLRRLTGKTIDISEPWGSSLERTHLAGREFSGGEWQTPQDNSFNRIGALATARTLEANPGASYYDYRIYLHLDPIMAEYLVYRNFEVSHMSARGAAGAIGEYFRGDRYVREQALISPVKRTVAGEARLMRAEEEMRGFGVLQNSLFGWFNPLLFLWHNPAMPSLSLRAAVFGWAEKKMQGETRTLKDRAMQTARGIEDWRRMQYTMVDVPGVSLVRPSTWHNLFSLQSLGQTTFFPGMAWRPGRRVHAASCARCGTGGYLGTICRKCQTLLYDAPYAPDAAQRRELPKKWAASWSLWAAKGSRR